MAGAISIPGENTATRARFGAPAQAPARTRWWVDVLAIAWLLWLYDIVTNLAPLRLHEALSNASGVLHAERVLHLDPELTLDRWLAGHHTLGLILSDYYDNAHFIITIGLLAWLWWRRADLYRPLRNLLLVTNALALIVFWRYPVAPPRMLSADGFTDVVSSTHAFGDWHDGPLASHANQLAAMPSLHMAWATWCAVVLWRLSPRRWVRALAVLHPLLTSLTVLATGNHFLLDLLAGLATLAVAMLLLAAAARAIARMRGMAPARGSPLEWFGRARRRLHHRAPAPAPRIGLPRSQRRVGVGLRADIESTAD